MSEVITFDNYSSDLIGVPHDV